MNNAKALSKVHQRSLTLRLLGKVYPDCYMLDTRARSRLLEVFEWKTITRKEAHPFAQFKETSFDPEKVSKSDQLKFEENCNRWNDEEDLLDHESQNLKWDHACWGSDESGQDARSKTHSRNGQRTTDHFRTVWQPLRSDRVLWKIVPQARSCQWNGRRKRGWNGSDTSLKKRTLTNKLGSSTSKVRLKSKLPRNKTSTLRGETEPREWRHSQGQRKTGLKIERRGRKEDAFDPKRAPH